MWFKATDGGINLRLIDYLPKSNVGALVFTTRNRKAATKLAGGNVVALAELDELAAKDILRSALIDKQALIDENTTINLLERLTFLPLAIVQAAAYINENDLPLSEYISLLDSTEEDMIEVLSEDFEDEGRYQDSKNPIEITWLISFERIRQQDQLAADYLSFMSCVDPRAIPQEMLFPPPSKKQLIEAIGTLSAYSFATKRPATDVMDQSFDLHRLVRLVTRNWLRKSGTLGDWSSKVVARLATIIKEAYGQQCRYLWRCLLPHAQVVRASSLFSTDVEPSQWFLAYVALCLEADGRYIEAERFYKDMNQALERTDDSGYHYTMMVKLELGRMYMAQGRLREAEELLGQTPNAIKKVFGEESKEMLTAMNEQALLLSVKGRKAEAKELHVQILRIRK
ncbi:MAG: hypothetical protein LQ340_000717 [Diploschistes diacapsis]|nr:MAG: hypothetical protein LQ340_000717 [Diploschistes diacapsis]